MFIGVENGICNEGNENATANYALRIRNEIQLNIVAENFSGTEMNDR